ncbi:hypothetical protein SAMN05660337_1466 [Maridesulfovibrio ferrireducens]|uniref:Uncharacterized protein n=1 Tax=Maridesulfovibrio ferrireducens TaxID=246191 RepID=A0A1G9FAR7_9BACT|nr:hypothetical protein [Maridesulfovibrio ferrireducens]SDK85480.1 hypothetical protein SAMN05660337_1466 [Maridesulfovibrio ferrireducens]
MNKDFDDVVTELNYIAAALDFLGEAMECYESEGKKLNKGGVSYIAKVIGERSSRVADLCWNIKLSYKNLPIADSVES